VSPDELKRILADHSLWLAENGGKCANLRNANLSEANLSGAIALKYAQCSFDAHGESGRQLSGVVIAGELRLFCGCFAGTLAELDAYIANGDERYKATRKLARDFIVAAIDAAQKEAQP
jgi:uncharacterized protein YjbI with pentapeptide repeats